MLVGFVFFCFSELMAVNLALELSEKWHFGASSRSFLNKRGLGEPQKQRIMMPIKRRSREDWRQQSMLACFLISFFFLFLWLSFVLFSSQLSLFIIASIFFSLISFLSGLCFALCLSPCLLLIVSTLLSLKDSRRLFQASFYSIRLERSLDPNRDILLRFLEKEN